MNFIKTLFASEILVKVLTLFLLNPEQEFYQAEINQSVHATLRNTQKILAKLSEAGLVSQYKRGHMSFYKANRDHYLFEDLKRLFLKTVALDHLLQASLKDLSHKIEAAFIYGSYARGEETAESDIDLFLLGNLSLKELSQVTGPLTGEIRREINTTVYSPQEFHQKYQTHNHFVHELLSCPKIWLIGSDDELSALAQGR